MVPRPALSSWDPALSLPARLWLWISTQSRGAVGPPSKRPIAAHHSHSFSKMPESLGLQQCGRCQEGWGQTQRIFLPLRRVLSATETQAPAALIFSQEA